MTIHKAGKINISAALTGAGLKYTNLAGTVNDDVGNPLTRTIYIYKTTFPEILYITLSDSAGDWSLSIVGNHNDKFRVICVGAAGENDQIFDHVIGAL